VARREARRELGYRVRVITLASLHTYPVKSCRGIAHSAIRLTAAGLEHDREWMFVGPGGRFITQREVPGLARVDVELGASTLRLSTSGDGGVAVSLEFQGARTEVNVWGDVVGAFDQGGEVAAWATALFGRELRLVRIDREAQRFSNRDWTGGLEAPNRFSDGYPLLVVSQASLDDLNSRLPAPLPMDRFRPNLVLEGLPPYGEDALRDLVSGGVRLRIVKPCTRCAITTTDQHAGVVTGEEPVRTLRTYRWDAGLKGVTFGQNTIVVDGAGRELRVGMGFS
jgi:hypothetical protein